MSARANAFTFVTDVRQYEPHAAFVARVPTGTTGRDDLLTVLYEVLTLPGYFGSNWDALSDCLRDFHWLDNKLVVIAHEDLPSLHDHDLRAYLEVLADSCLDWRPGEQHALEVVFPNSLKARVESILSS